MYRPSSTEIAAAMQCEPSPYENYGRLLQSILDDNQDWCLSEERLYRSQYLRMQNAVDLDWNAIVIHPDYLLEDSLANLDMIRSYLDPCQLLLDPDSTPSASSLCDILGYGPVCLVAQLYDRRPVTDWYYSVYAIHPDLRAHCPLNSIVSSVRKPSLPCVRGPAVVIRNGPKSNAWSPYDEVDDDGLARTIWWYLRSGYTPPEVFGRRNFERYLQNALP